MGLAVVLDGPSQHQAHDEQRNQEAKHHQAHEEQRQRSEPQPTTFSPRGGRGHPQSRSQGPGTTRSGQAASSRRRQRHQTRGSEQTDATSASPMGSKPITRNAVPPAPLATSCRTYMGHRGNSCCCLLLHSARLELWNDAAADTMKGDAEGKHWGALEHCAVGRLSLHASVAHGVATSTPPVPVRRRIRHLSVAVCMWEQEGTTTHCHADSWVNPEKYPGVGDWAPETPHQVDGSVHMTVNRREVAGQAARSNQPNGGGQAAGRIKPLHSAMMRALWIWRTHEIRLMASCNQVARACGSSGAILDRKAF